MGLHNQTKQCFPQYLQSLQEQENPNRSYPRNIPANNAVSRRCSSMGAKPQKSSDGWKQIPTPLRDNQYCTCVQSHSDHIEGRFTT